MVLRPTRLLVSLAVVYVTCIAATGQTPVTPTTTLATETANNTSTSNTFQRQPNGNIGAGNISKLPVRSLLYSGSTTKVLAHVMTWFGDPQHMGVGYTSSDATQIHKQVSDMLSRGIGGVVLDWNGPQDGLGSNTVAGFRTEAEGQNGAFTFTVMEDVASVVDYSQQNGCDVTQKIIDDLNYAYTNFETSTAYMHQNGRPVVFFFGTEAYYTDWNKVRANISGNPVLIFRNQEAFGQAQADGAFSWMNVTDGDPNNQDLAGLDGLYSTAQQNPAKLVIGGAWKGFNDTLAAWSSNRIINQQCGQTWLATLREAGKYYSSSNQLPLLQLVTWNDYEEATEIETGVDNCLSISESIQGSTLQWNIGANGNENAVSAYRVFISTDGPSAPNPGLMPLADVAAGTHSLDLSQYSLATATYTLYVEAIGKASIANHMSRAVAYRPGHQPPTVSVNASPGTGTAPVTVNAMVTASAASGSSIAGTSIDFGDGAIMSGPTASHQYGNAGTYTITATATDNLGVSSSSTTTVTVTASASYGVVISSPAAGNTTNQFVEVKATATTPNPPITAIWVYVDNQLEYQSSNQSSIDASLKLNNGSHHIVVQAWDWTGALFKGDVSINVIAPPSTLSAVLDVTQLPSVGQYGVMACTARSTDTNGFVTSSAVDFGDGTTAGGTTTYHNYGAAGTYTVKTTVTDDHGYTSSTSTNVKVGINTPPFGWLDSPAGSTVSQNTTLQVSGWAADQEDGAPVARVQLFLDGTSVGNATLGLLRPDVANAFNDSRYTKSGWSFSYSVASLTAGSHTLAAVAYDSQGASTTLRGSGQFTVNAANAPPFGWVDRPSSTTLNQNTVLQVSGWAADQQDGAPVTRVQVFLDGTAIGTATLGQSRPDVAAAYNDSRYTNSGWSFNYNVGTLSGNHVLTAVAYDSQGASAQLRGPGTFTVTIGANTAPFGWLDYISSTTVAPNTSLQVSGWAADKEDGSPVSRVQLLLDGAPIGNATLGASRPDVASYFNDSRYTNSGWNFSYNVGNLSSGSHTITAIAYDSTGVSAQLSGSAELTVTP